jgi:hypothetical protein
LAENMDLSPSRGLAQQHPLRREKRDGPLWTLTGGGEKIGIDRIGA